MSDLKAQIQADMKAAMKAKEPEKLGTIRMLIAALKQREIDEQTSLDDAGVLQVINKMVKQRRDAAQQFIEGDRPELAAKEQSEINVLEHYLPQPLSEAEVTAAIDAAFAETGANSMKDMGKVMGLLQKQLTGRADMSKVSQIIREKLQ